MNYYGIRCREDQSGIRKYAIVLLAVLVALAMMPAAALEANAEDGPTQGWITFPSGIVYDSSDVDEETDYYEAEEPVAFDDDGNIVFQYSVAGQQNYGIDIILNDEEGNSVEGASAVTTTGAARTVTISGLEADKTYSICWPKLSANGRNPQRNVVLTFTTKASGSVDPGDQTTEEDIDYDAQGIGGNTIKLMALNGSGSLEIDASVIKKGEDILGYRNTITSPESLEEGIVTFGITLSAGFNNFNPDGFNTSSRPVIHIYEDDGETVASEIDEASIADFDASAKVLTIRSSESLEEGTYIIEFGSDVCGNNTSKRLGVPVSFEFAIEAVDQEVVAAVELLAELDGLSPVTSADYDKIMAAKAAYDALTDEQKEKVPEYAVEDLQTALGALVLALKQDLDTAKEDLNKAETALNETKDELDKIKQETGQIDITYYAASLKPAKYTYNGKEKEPAVTVNGLKDGDFTVSYSNNKKIGTAKAVINGTGDYKGTITKTFRILPGKAAISKATPGKKKVTVKIKSLKGGVKYQISVQQKGKKAKTYSSGTKTSKTIKKLVSKKQYKIKVRAYKKVGTKTYYGAWSKAKTVTIK